MFADDGGDLLQFPYQLVTKTLFINHPTTQRYTDCDPYRVVK
jgi:hypothetical protein